MGWKDETIIYIPTYQRIDKQVTLQRIPKSSGVDDGRVVLVAPKNEVRKLEKLWNVPVIAQPDDIKNIAQKRAWIIEQCRYERMFMLDDDLRFCYRSQFVDGMGRYATVDNEHLGANRAWTNLERALEHFAHVGMGARMGANARKFRWLINSRCMYVLGYQTKILQRECKLGSMDTREDMDYTLQLLRKGYRNLVGYRLVVDQQFAKAGGMTSERTIEKSDKDAERLARRYPGVVEVQQKQYKESVPRKEVRVAWRKAFVSKNSRPEETELMRKLLTKWGLDSTRNKKELL